MKIPRYRPTKRTIAEFRYQIIGSLFAAPPPPRGISEAIRALAEREWHFPGSEYPERISVRTLERWYHRARRQSIDPACALIPKIRSDTGICRSLTEAQKEWLRTEHEAHGRWSWLLLADNLRYSPVGPGPSYSTVARWMKANGLMPKSGTGRRRDRDVRSFESEHSGELLHLDFHHGSLPVLAKDGSRVYPLCVAFIDDYSRYVAHCQWYIGESAEELAHGIIQAFQKAGLWMRVMSDNGSAMISEEFKRGLARLGVRQSYSAPLTPRMNGKIESFWKPVEARLLAMIGERGKLKLSELNHLTQAWLYTDYNAKIHSETAERPCQRFQNSNHVLRPCPPEFNFARAFRRKVNRRVRRTDGTISLESVRFQLPLAYRQLEEVSVSYAQWDLSEASLLHPDTEQDLVDIYPVDKHGNALGIRDNAPVIEKSKSVVENSENIFANLPPLLEHCLKTYAETHALLGYIPHERGETP